MENSKVVGRCLFCNETATLNKTTATFMCQSCTTARDNNRSKTLNRVLRNGLGLSELNAEFTDDEKKGFPTKDGNSHICFISGQKFRYSTRKELIRKIANAHFRGGNKTALRPIWKRNAKRSWHQKDVSGDDYEHDKKTDRVIFCGSPLMTKSGYSAMIAFNGRQQEAETIATAQKETAQANMLRLSNAIQESITEWNKEVIANKNAWENRAEVKQD